MNDNNREELIVHQFPCLSDNYGYLIHDPVTGKTATVDTPDAIEIERQLNSKNWSLDYIYNTHHHHDHIGGNLALKKKYQCDVYASVYDSDRIPGIDHTLSENDILELGPHKIRIIDAPGHTLGHILYFFVDSNILFCGDTLFAMGCGRLFEGSPEIMWKSLEKILALPDETLIYCAHEYTLANARFAHDVFKGNVDITKRLHSIEEQRANNQATIPTRLSIEKKTNPFLLAANQTSKSILQMEDNTDEACFRYLRHLKDNY